MKKVLIATLNPFEIEGISKAFQDFFPGEEIIIDAVKSESGVSKQPIGSELFKGVDNRICSVTKDNLKYKYDYYVSCENGLEVSGEFWFNTYLVKIVNAQTNEYQYGKSPYFPISIEYVKEILYLILKKDIDNFLDTKVDINHFTGGLVNHVDLIRLATIMAFAGFNW